MIKEQFYAELKRDLSTLLDGETNFIAVLSNASALLNQRLDSVNWVGFYLMDGNQLVLGPFQGKIACVRIAVGKGVCGTAVAENRVQRSVMFMRSPAISPAMRPVMRKSCCRCALVAGLLAFLISIAQFINVSIKRMSRA